MIRRLIGSVVMLTVPAERVLALASIRAFIMMLIATFSAGRRDMGTNLSRAVLLDYVANDLHATDQRIGVLKLKPPRSR